MACNCGGYTPNRWGPSKVVNTKLIPRCGKCGAKMLPLLKKYKCPKCGLEETKR